jgi:hypothetical protein
VELTFAILITTRDPRRWIQLSFSAELAYPIVKGQKQEKTKRRIESTIWIKLFLYFLSSNKTGTNTTPADDVTGMIDATSSIAGKRRTLMYWLTPESLRRRLDVLGVVQGRHGT